MLGNQGHDEALRQLEYLLIDQMKNELTIINLAAELLQDGRTPVKEKAELIIRHTHGADGLLDECVRLVQQLKSN